MSKRIEYQGKIYILESTIDDTIKTKLEDKIEDALDDVLGGKSKGASKQAFGNGALEETEEVETAPVEAPVEEVPAEDPRISGAIEGIKETLGVLDISPDVLPTLQMILEEILASASVEAPVADATLSEAPDTILHEGRIFRKIGKLGEVSNMMESTTVAPPKSIRVAGKIFTLCEGQI